MTIEATDFLKTGDDKLIEELEEFMFRHLEDYKAVKNAYEEEVKDFKCVLGEDEGYIDGLIRAYKSTIVSDMLFAYELGRNANIAHFRDPGAYPFIQLSPEVYLQEHVMRRMPKRTKACAVISNIVEFLKERDISCNAIIEYFAYLETICGKYAHFRGYVDGNTIFQNTIPGYAEDTVFTAAYRHHMKEVTGADIRLVI